MSTTQLQRDEPTTLVDTFKGAGWEEGNQFIRAIRISAFKEGRQRDMAWMADFAALHFSHAALSWHSRLPQDVRQDWSKLETALLDRWPPPEGIDGPQVEPTPAAAPLSHPSNNLKVEPPLQGVLKVLPSGSNEHFYVQFYRNICQLTRNVKEALHVRCNVNSLGGTALLERIDNPSHSWLGVGWWKPMAGVGRTSTLAEYSSILIVDSDELKPSWATTRSWQIMTCTVSANGEIRPIWKIGTDRSTLSVFVSFPNLRLVADTETFSKFFKDDARATLIIEPID